MVIWCRNLIFLHILVITLLFKITGAIGSSERFSRHHKGFVCVLCTLYLNYYDMHFTTNLGYIMYKSAGIYMQMYHTTHF